MKRLKEWIGCFFGHNWSAWLTTHNAPYGSNYYRLTQERVCYCCGKKQISDKITSA